MTKWTRPSEGYNFIDNIFLRAARIVRGEVYMYNERYQQTYAGRDWFIREYSNHEFHEAVRKMMSIYRPDDWQQLLLEWPHKSVSDPNRLAYTRDERAGEADRQVITTIGKYLTRHFSHAPDNLIRDIVAEFTYGGKIELTHALPQMIRAVLNGPASCMTKDFDILCEDGKRRHPYAVYDPSLGWGMAVRYDGDDVLGRCLVWEDPDNEDNRGFVRSYKREKGYSSHSGADEAIEAYLTSLGYAKWRYWPDDTPIKRYSLSRGGYLMPYIDGGCQSVDEDTFTIHSNGDISANNTNGMANAYECECADCGVGMDEDDGYYVGMHEDHHVCCECIDNYTMVYGRYGRQYYIENDRAVYVGDDYYDIDYLSDNNIVELACGDFEYMDNAVYIDSEDAYYHCDDDDICYAEDTNQYELKDNCWYCEGSDRWYTDDEDSVEIDGIMYHPDHAPEQDEDDTDTETTNETN